MAQHTFAPGDAVMVAVKDRVAPYARQRSDTDWRVGIIVRPATAHSDWITVWVDVWPHHTEQLYRLASHIRPITADDMAHMPAYLADWLADRQEVA